jgi:deoxyribodipyrimidine photo-lyase
MAPRAATTTVSGRVRRPAAGAGSGGTIVWFRQDLRLADNPALLAATARAGAVIPVYIWSPGEEGEWPPGAASRWWLHRSLTCLETKLASHGSRLIVRTGPSLDVLRELVGATRATALFWNRRYEPPAVRRDALVQAALARDGVETQSHNASLLFEPDDVRTRSGGPYRVFTPFWAACLSRQEPDLPRDAPTNLVSPTRWPASLTVADLGLEPKVDWAAGLRSAWRPGEAGALTELKRLLGKSLSDYPLLRDRPDRRATSRLSPYLHHGEIGPRQIWHAVADAVSGPRVGGGAQGRASGAESFLRQIGWREFAIHLLHHFPHTPLRALRPDFDRFPWSRDRAILRRWQRGRTGYPIVDAGMRELWKSGWMHNRVRMIVASFLVKDLLISWNEGARWFWDTLVDADLANNTLGWQWVAGSGADAAPFFRIFNPETQGRKFDPHGEYVRRWVPELARLSDKWIHAPSKAPDVILRQARVELGESYPLPAVDHAAARVRALEVLSYHARHTLRRAVYRRRRTHER